MDRDDDTFLQRVLSAFRKNDWQNVLALNETSDNVDAQKLMWVWPSETNLVFIKKIIDKFRLKGIISIGCGCGLFEWIMQQATELPVVGYEVNEEWWNSKYSNPHFIDFKFPQMPPTPDILSPKFALFFCYFNNGPAFLDYVKAYDGKVILIIGPADGTGRYTNPAPFNANFGNGDTTTKWQLYQYEEIKQTKDFIAVYIKTKINK